MNDKQTRGALSVLFEKIKPVYLFLGLSVISLIFMVGMVSAMFDPSGPLPPPRKPPPKVEKATINDYRFKLGYYLSVIQEDAKKIGIAAPSLKSLHQSNLYFAEFTGKQHLRPGDRLNTQHLLLVAKRQKVWVGDPGQGYKVDHLLLEITNKTNYYLAYRIQTFVSGHCRRHGILPYNALALEPKQKQLRVECVYSRRRRITVKQVEVLQISQLGYHYVSRLDPNQLQVNPRVASGHTPGKLPLCKMLPWQIFHQAFKMKTAQWYDVIDFYSRHNCDEYTFFIGYRWTDKIIKHLPAKAEN